jgi:hypothetical protein
MGGRGIIGAPKEESIEVSVLLARETDAPASVKPLQWHLLTNRHADTLEAAAELINWYSGRRDS